MQIRYNLNFSDYMAVQKLHAQRNFWSRLNWVCANILNPLLGGAILALLIFVIVVDQLKAYIFFLAFPGIYLLLSPWFRRIQFKRLYKRTRTCNNDCTINFSEEIIHAETSGISTNYKWEAVQKVREDKQSILLYIAQAIFIVIPKRVCTTGQINELHMLIQQRTHPLETNS